MGSGAQNRRGLLGATAAAVFAFGLGGLAVKAYLSREPPSADAPSVLVQLREVARLETLEVSVYKKVTFEPDPQGAPTLWGELAQWAKQALRSPKGRAILFADVHLGFDVSKLDERSLWIHGATVEVVLPPVTALVELKPQETEVIASNLNSQETAELFQRAKLAFEAEVLSDPKLKQKARASAQKSVRALLLTLGFREVRFVDHLPARANSL